MTSAGSPPVLDSNVSDADVTTVWNGLAAFNSRHAVRESRSGPLRFVLRASSGDVAGGVLGSTQWGWLHVETLWVADEFRGLGFGTTLLRAAEDEARARGCTHAWLDTFSFQAPAFYRLMGYAQFGVLADYPAGHSRHFFMKELTRVGGGTGHRLVARTREFEAPDDRLRVTGCGTERGD